MKLSSIIESILFIHGDPMAIEKIAEIAGVSVSAAKEALALLEFQYGDRGLVLIKIGDAYQMGTHPKNAPYIEEMRRSEFSQELSRSSRETIAVIAYKGPISRAEIDYIRGVHSSYAVRNLLMRGLVVREDGADASRGYRYSVGADFLQYLGLSKIEDLPGYEEMREQSAALLAGIDADENSVGMP